MTIFELNLGDSAAVETLRGNIVAGEVVDRQVRDRGGPAPYVAVQVSPNVAIRVPESEATQP